MVQLWHADVVSTIIGRIHTKKELSYKLSAAKKILFVLLNIWKLSNTAKLVLVLTYFESTK